MKNLVIAIPSKGRLYGETFTLVKKIKEKKEKIDIYVYVDEVELEAYSEEYPDFIFVPHNKKSIGEIRLFMQEHQYHLGNDMIMMDDDIKTFLDINGFQISINRIIRETKEALEQIPFVYYYHNGQQSLTADPSNTEFGIFTPASVVALSSELFESGIKYRNDVISEDFDFYFQLLMQDMDMKLLPFFIDKNVDDLISHFTLEFRNSSIIETYLKYGDVIEMRQNYDALMPNIAGAKIANYKQNGAVYSEESDTMLKNIKENRFPGYELLENWESGFNL
jgi:hypothetical protein